MNLLHAHEIITEERDKLKALVMSGFVKTNKQELSLFEYSVCLWQVKETADGIEYEFDLTRNKEGRMVIVELDSLVMARLNQVQDNKARYEIISELIDAKTKEIKIVLASLRKKSAAKKAKEALYGREATMEPASWMPTGTYAQ